MSYATVSYCTLNHILDLLVNLFLHPNSSAIKYNINKKVLFRDGGHYIYLDLLFFFEAA